MPVHDFHGDTFVAFTDISGFKEMMKSERRAVRALDRLNRAGYNQLQQHPEVNGFFVSDCGILFVRDNRHNLHQKLTSLLRVVQGINEQLLHDDIILTTSIAYGEFSYHQRLEFPGIEKNPIYGNAYVTAFLDNENGKPKIQPGQCRITTHNLEQVELLAGVNGNHLNRVVKERNHYYFYWMVNDPLQINDFKNKYNDSYQLKYQGMLNALKMNG